MYHNRSLEIASSFGFSLTNDLRKYLGVHLQHNRVGASSFNHVINKLLQRLSSWKATPLFFAGRLTLGKSVLTAIPAYQMQTSLLPAPVCDSILSQFFVGRI